MNENGNKDQNQNSDFDLFGLGSLFKGIEKLVDLADKLEEKGGDMNKLTKKHLSALLFVCLSVDMDEVKSKKPELARKLSACMANVPAKLSTEIVQTNN